MYFLINPFLSLFLTSILVVVAITDLRSQKIPNLITFPTIIFGLIYFSITSGWKGFLFSLEGLALGIAMFSVPYLMGVMGAGGVKLMGAVGAIIGPKGVFVASLFSAVAGGIYALIVLLFNIQYFKNFLIRSAITVKSFALTRQFISVPTEESENKPKLCYGVAIAIGTFSYVLLEIYGINPV
jgi:prepilin peptidase CpaA